VNYKGVSNMKTFLDNINYYETDEIKETEVNQEYILKDDVRNILSLIEDGIYDIKNILDDIKGLTEIETAKNMIEELYMKL